MPANAPTAACRNSPGETHQRPPSANLMWFEADHPPWSHSVHVQSMFEYVLQLAMVGHCTEGRASLGSCPGMWFILQLAGENIMHLVSVLTLTQLPAPVM